MTFPEYKLLHMNEMKTIGTPNNVDVLMHCHTTPSIHPRIDAPAVQDALNELIFIGAIVLCEKENLFRTTPMGRAWVKAICNVPQPKQVYVDANGNILE